MLIHKTTNMYVGFSCYESVSQTTSIITYRTRLKRKNTAMAQQLHDVLHGWEFSLALARHWSIWMSSRHQPPSEPTPLPAQLTPASPEYSLLFSATQNYYTNHGYIMCACLVIFIWCRLQHSIPSFPDHYNRIRHAQSPVIEKSKSCFSAITNGQLVSHWVADFSCRWDLPKPDQMLLMLLRNWTSRFLAYNILEPARFSSRIGGWNGLPIITTTRYRVCVEVLSQLSFEQLPIW